MLTLLRERFGKFVVYAIILLITFVFVFFGVFNPKATRGLHEASVAGTVNGEPISIQDFQRELNRRIEFFKNMTGGKLTEDQLRAFQLREAVFQEMARRKLLVQLGPKQGLDLAPQEIKARIKQISAFQKNGQFDYQTYQSVLTANGYTASGFEKAIREDAILAAWEKYFQVRTSFSEAELKAEYEQQGRKRKLTAVVLTFPVGKDLKESQDFEKQTETTAQRVAQLLKPGKVQVPELASLVKAAKTSVINTDWILASAPQIPGFGAHPQLTQDLSSGTVFSDARMYRSVQGILVARVADKQEPSSEGFVQTREKLAAELSQRKTRSLFDAWLKEAATHAKIEKNDAIVSDLAGGG